MRKRFVILKTNFRTILTGTILVSILFWFIFPGSFFSDPLSTVVYDRGGEILGARIADDGQWRFPPPDSVPDKFKQAILLYEDQYFYYHPGINLLSFGRAALQNIQSGEVVSGGSTLTMQVIRLSRKGKSRTIFQKIFESLYALRYELIRTKDEILVDYAANAPFGGNVVGLEAASWRYFGTHPGNLTYAESAMLAVLPNAPSLIHPGKNRELLKAKRNRLLLRMYEKEIIDSITFALACEEEIPDKPHSLPNLAPHVTDRYMILKPHQKIHTSISAEIQTRADEIVSIHHNRLQDNQIHNLACLVMEIESGSILAYIGNNDAYLENRHGNNVDVIQASRSTGSILKPLLFAGMIDQGVLLPTALVPDIPVNFGSYTPKNYDRGYEGAVPAYQALERSLNVPSVIMLKKFGVEPFLELLRSLGFTTFNYSANHYGLTLILGGAEATLWELSGVYGSLARILNHYNISNGNYFKEDLHMPLLLQDEQHLPLLKDPLEHGILSAASIYHTFEYLLEVNRPDELSLWYLMNSSRLVAWKTGTSYGFRDAWAIGITPEYLVAVWAGNSDGEGRPGLTGLQAAAPLMFQLFDMLPESTWFDPPLDDLNQVTICEKSGYLAGPHCPEKSNINTNISGSTTEVCPYHKIVHLSPDRKFRVTSDCIPVSEIVNESWFILPPLMEWYYKRKDPRYRELPQFMNGCNSEDIDEMEVIYPKWGNHIVIPRELDGTRGRLVMELTHRDENATVYWHIDERFIGVTTRIHQMAVDIDPGEHILTILDEKGEEKKIKFTILGTG